MKAQIISFHCVLKSYTGKFISSAYYQEVLTHPEGRSGVIAVLIQGLQNLRKGEKRKIRIAANQAYGFYEPNLLIKISRKDLPLNELVEIGHEIITQDDHGDCRSFRVIEVLDRYLILDGNHPLAGQDLIFEVEATATRKATRQEVEKSKSQILRANLH